MRKLRFWWDALSPRVWEELEAWGGVLLALSAALLLYATLKAQAAQAAEFPADLGAPTLLFQAADGGYAAAAPLQTDLRISVAGVVARVRVAQRFRNSGTSYVEAVYALPLPDDAAVDRLSMQIGERVIQGEIHERQQAERIYGEARAAGQRASLVRQTSANLFTTAVANIAPGETIDITIEYLQTASYDAGRDARGRATQGAVADSGEFSLRVPLTLTPRYGAPDTPEGIGALASGVLPDAAVLGSEMAAGSRSTAWHEATVHAVLAPGMPLDWIGSRSHEVKLVHERGAAWSRAHNPVANGAAANGVLVQPPPAELYVLDTVAPRVSMDRDLVIAWRPQVGVAPAIAALTETVDDTTYALLMILPPAAAAQATSAPREQIYVIDTSGSMGGASMEQAKAALKDALGRLRSGDRFNVIQFDSTTSSLYSQPVSFSQQTYAQALRYVDSLAADGGTEIGAAIDAALAQPSTANYVRQVIFITDGAVGGETALFSAIEQRLGDARLFTIGIGSAPNSYFMRKAAQFGRGTYTHIGNVTDVAEKMTALFTKLEHVALSNVVVDWPEAVELYPPAIPDLYAGEPLVVTASFPAARDRPLLTTAFGQAAGMPWRQSVAGSPSELPGIAALWARRKIEHLIDSRVAGIDEALIRKLVVTTALEHHLVSPYTSLVAVDQTPARSAAAALERRNIENIVPAGAQWAAAMPQTATPAPLLRALGAVVLALAGGLLFAAPRQEACMNRPWRGAMPVMITLPLGLERRPRARRRRRKRLALGLLLALGFALLAAGFWLPAKAELAQQLLNRAWDRTTEGDRAAKLWPWADTHPVARLSLPDGGEPLTVLAGASGRNLAFAPALMDGSAELGTPGVSVIAGHRDTHFRPLATLAIGDALTIERPDGSTLSYEVTALDVVDSARAQLRLDADESIVVLVTCWPFDSADVGGSWRYVVTARVRF